MSRSRPRSCPPTFAASLVVLGSTVTALAVARDAFAHGLTTVVVDTRRGIASQTRRATIQILEGRDDAEIVHHLCRTIEGGPRHLIATEDGWVRFVIRHRSALDRAFTTVLHPANDALAICLDKAAFARWCRTRGFDAPRIYLAGDAGDADVEFPVLLRPADTRHGLPAADVPKAVEVQSRTELEAWLTRFAAAQVTPIVTESLLRHRLTQYSVPVARAKGRTVAFVARKLRPGPEWCTAGTYVELCPNDEVEALARRAVDALDYFGIGEAEILHSHDTGRNYLIEFNARPWIQYALAPASGHDLLGFVLAPDAYDPAGARKSGVQWLDLHSDLYVALSRARGMLWRGEVSLGGYVASLVKARAHAKLDSGDLRPWLVDAKDLVRQVVTAALRRARG